MTPRLRNGLRIAALNLLVLLAIEAAAQLVWRFTAHEGEQPRDPRSWLAQAKLSFRDGLYVPDAACLWRLAPGYTGSDEGARFWGGAALALNAQGMRGPERRPAAARVLVIGGSHPMGMYVRWEQSYAGRLEALLRAAGLDAQVHNASAPGYTSWQARRWLETHAAAFLNDAPAVIVFDAGVNDTLALTTEYPVPDKDVREPPAWARAAGSWLEVSATFRLLKRAFRSDSGLSEGTPTAGTRVSREDHAANVAAVRALGARLGVEVLVLSQVSVDVGGTGRAVCVFDEAAAGDRRVDVCATFAGLGAAAGPLFVDPVHATAEGHDLIARAIFSRLQTIRWPPLAGR